MRNDSDIRRSVKSTPEQKSLSINYNLKTIIKILVVILLILLSFALGKNYGEHHATSSTSAAVGTRGFRANGAGFGTVASVSSNSITVDDVRSGTSKTFSITSSTKITNDGQSVSVSSIAKGDRVIVIPTSSGGSAAASIMINPSFGGGFGGAPNQSVGSSTSGGSSTPGSTPGSSTGSGTGSASGSITTQ